MRQTDHWRSRATGMVSATTMATPAAAAIAVSAAAPEEASGHPDDLGHPPPPWPVCLGVSAGATSAECTMTRTMSRWPCSQWPGSPLMKQKKPGRWRRKLVAPSVNAANGSVALQASKAGRSTTSTESFAY